jgi:hypothetical protein
MKIYELENHYVFSNIRDNKGLFNKNEIKHIRELKLKNGKEYGLNDILEIMRWCLRGVMWCKIMDKGIYIHIGYGYYICIGGLEIGKGFMENGLKEGITIEEIKKQ